LKIEGTYLLHLPQDRAYALLQDPEILAKCIPGCDRLDKVAENEYEMKMKMAIASMSGHFDGRVKLTDQQPPNSFRLIVEGKGKIGFLKGDGLLRLESGSDETTNVTYEGDVQIGGTMAAVGQRLLDTTSRMMIKKFFDKFAELTRDLKAPLLPPITAASQTQT
jgi:carbon monoxide dehydrogenase subunit G